MAPRKSKRKTNSPKISTSAKQQESSINTDAVLEHLRLLGYKDSDTVHFGGFFSKTDSRYQNDKGRKASSIFPKLPSQLEEWVSEERNIFFVVNQGGTKNNEISKCLAHFFEYDDPELRKEDQREMWKHLGLPEPTFQLDTGGKSIHNYFVLAEPQTNIEQWRELQTDLVSFTNSDKALKNSNRMMRLAGYPHPSTGEITKITTKSEKYHSFQDLRAAIPSQEKIKSEQVVKSEFNPFTPDETEKLAIEALNCIPPRVPGEGTYDMYRNILWGLKSEFGLEKAIELMDAHSPSSQCGWDIRQVASSGGDKINIGTLFFHAKNYGFKFPKRKSSRPHFESNHDVGLEWVSFKEEEDGTFRPARIRIGDHLTATAFVNSPKQDEAGIYIEFQDRKGKIRRLTIPRSDLVGDGREVLKILASNGYFFSRKQKNLLLDYLSQLGKDCEQEYTITDKTGWVEDSFVLPGRTYGDKNIRFGQVEPPTEPRFEQSGTLEDWKNDVAKLAIRNSRLIFAIGVALMSPLLQILGLESGGFHFYGPTSTGKTTMIKVAASIYGKPKKIIKQWRHTANGLEATATEHNHLTLFLDEIGQALAREVAQIAYMLANGQGKTRMQKNLKVNEPLTWLLTFLSTGEISLLDYLQQAQINLKGGQENRMPSIPACPDGGHGIFENLHGMNGREFVTELEQNTSKFYGTVFDEFLKNLVEVAPPPEFKNNLQKRHLEITKSLAAVAPFDEVTGRVAQRFAAAQLTLELAIQYQVVPFTQQDIQSSISKIFSEWIDARGGVGSIELKQALDRIEYIFSSQEYSNRILNVSTDEDGKNEVRVDPFKSSCNNLLAYKKTDDDGTTEYWIPPQVFEQEFAAGIDQKLLINELLEKGWLLPSTEKDRFTCKRRLNKSRQNFYIFLPFWQGESDADLIENFVNSLSNDFSV